MPAFLGVFVISNRAEDEAERKRLPPSRTRKKLKTPGSVPVSRPNLG